MSVIQIHSEVTLNLCPKLIYFLFLFQKTTSATAWSITCPTAPSTVKSLTIETPTWGHDLRVPWTASASTSLSTTRTTWCRHLSPRSKWRHTTTTTWATHTWTWSPILKVRATCFSFLLLHLETIFSQVIGICTLHPICHFLSLPFNAHGSPYISFSLTTSLFPYFLSTAFLQLLHVII